MRYMMKMIMVFCLGASISAVLAANNDENSSLAMAQFEQNVQAAIDTSKTPAAAKTEAGQIQAGVDNALAQTPSVGQLMTEKPTANQQEAFGDVLQQAMPMSPTQIIDLKRRVAAAQLASSLPATEPPRPVTSSRIVNLAPGATPPVIRLEQGFISTLDFVDSSGNPWPIEAFDNGNPDAFNVSWNQKGSSFMIQARKAYTYGNIAVSLQGLATPIMLTLVPGQKIVDYRVDLRIPGSAPGSEGSLSGDNVLPESATAQLLNVLNGVAPDGGQAMRVLGGDAQAWVVKDKLFLRTRFAMLSPGWVGSMKSPDGTYAYMLPNTPTILVSQYGTPVQFKIMGIEP